MTRRPVIHDHAARDEAEANEFAMCLLMPEDFLAQEVGKFRGGITKDFQIGALAKKFQVPKTLMTIRLFKLGYITHFSFD